MRLVDADIIEKQFDLNTWQGEMMIAIARGLPTAYDVDKVVEQLDKASDHYECEEQGREDVYMVDLEEAIEIVKGGGKDE